MSRPYYLKFKVCNTCKNILHISKFNKNKKCKYGVGTRCKECYRLYYNESTLSWNKKDEKRKPKRIKEVNSR